MFPKVKRCQSVKIWSRQDMTSEMMQFGWSAFNSYQRMLEAGKASEEGCLYANKFYSAFCKKTKGGMCSTCVVDEGIKS